MKKLNKLTALALSLMMLLSMAFPALAVDPLPTPCPNCGGYHDYIDEDLTAEELEAWYQQRLHDEKVALGYFYPDGVNILHNSAPIDVPVVYFAEGVSMVDLGRFVTAVGGSFNRANNTATLNAGRLCFTPDSAIVSVGVAGQESTLSTKTRVDNGILYAPLRDVATLLGMGVHWNGEMQAIYTFDYTALAQKIDKDFTILNKYLAANKIDFAQAVEAFGQLKASGTLYGDGKSYTGTLDASVSGTFKGADGNFNGKVSFDITQFHDVIAQSPYFSELATYAEKPQTIPFDYILNSEKETAYFQSADLAKLYAKYNELPAEKTGDNVWFSMYYPNMGNILSDPLPLTIGTYYAELRKQYNDREEYWRQMYSDDEYAYLYDFEDYFSDDTVNWLYVFAADDAFVKSGTTYTTKLGLTDLMTRVEQYVGSYGTYQLSGIPTFQFSLTLTENSASSMSARFDLTAREISFSPYEVKVNGQFSGLKGSATVEVKGDYVGKFQVTTTSDLKNTAKAPATEPPAGSIVADDLYYVW